MDYTRMGLMTDEELKTNSMFDFCEEITLDATGKGGKGRKAAATALSLAPAAVAASGSVAAMASV